MTVFAILAHDDPAMLRRLIKTLNGAAAFVHIDARVDLASYDSVARIGSLQNAKYVSDRFAANWGGFSILEAMISSGREATSDASVNEHIVYLSGHCYPVKPVSHFDRYLRHSNWTVHARAHSAQGGGIDHRWRITERHGFDNWPNRLGPPKSLRRRTARFAYRKLHPSRMLIPDGLDIAIGSQWMALPRECLQDVVASYDSGDFEVYRDAFAPDEIAIQSFIYNSEWIGKTQFKQLENSATRVSELPNFHVLDRELKGRLTGEDLVGLDDRAYFARKFSSDQVKLLDSIDTEAARRL